MSDEIRFDPEILRRVWGQILPIAADNYDNAIERLHRTGIVLIDTHIMSMVDTGFFHAVTGGSTGTPTTWMLQRTQETILATADAVKIAMEEYGYVDAAASERLAEAEANFLEMTGPHEVEGQP